MATPLSPTASWYDSSVKRHRTSVDVYWDACVIVPRNDLLRSHLRVHCDSHAGRGSCDDFSLAKHYLGKFDTGLRAADAFHLAIASNRRAATIYSLDETLLGGRHHVGPAGKHRDCDGMTVTRPMIEAPLAAMQA